MGVLLALAGALGGAAIGYEWPFATAVLPTGETCRDNMPLGLGVTAEGCPEAVTRARQANALAGAAIGATLGMVLGASAER